MSTTPNGWTVIESTGCVDLVVYGVHFPNGVRKGAVAVVLRWVAEQHHNRVEHLVPGWCWGYDKKKIKGSDEWSEHAAGNAIDANAPRHNMGSAPTSSAGGYTPQQVDTIHDIERESGNVVRSGVDFSRPDGMHWEIIGNVAQVEVFANLINAQKAVTVDPSNPTVQAINYFFYQAWRGATGQAKTPFPSDAVLKTRLATPAEVADRFARNAFLFTSHADGVDPEPVE